MRCVRWPDPFLRLLDVPPLTSPGSRSHAARHRRRARCFAPGRSPSVRGHAERIYRPPPRADHHALPRQGRVAIRPGAAIRNSYYEITGSLEACAMWSEEAGSFPRTACSGTPWGHLHRPTTPCRGCRTPDIAESKTDPRRARSDSCRPPALSHRSSMHSGSTADPRHTQGIAMIGPACSPYRLTLPERLTRAPAIELP